MKKTYTSRKERLKATLSILLASTFLFVTGVTTVLADFYEDNSPGNLYTATGDEGIAPAYFIAPTWSYNDVDFPLPEYPAELGENWKLPEEILSTFPHSYGGSIECDGFARYAHDRFFHLHKDGDDNPDWRTDVYQPGDYFGATPDQIKDRIFAPVKIFNQETEPNGELNTDDIKEFFESLNKGAFVRYVSASDPTPHDGRHSIVFAGLDGTTGIFAYEANQDGNNGVSYQRYTYTTLKKTIRIFCIMSTILSLTNMWWMGCTTNFAVTTAPHIYGRPTM